MISWKLHSVKDPRWNVSGTDAIGMSGMPEGARRKIEELKQLYGNPPDDLVWSYTKE